MTKLNQILAIESGVKSRTEAKDAELYHAIQKVDHFSGFNKTYKKLFDDGEDQPAETKNVVQHAENLLTDFVLNFAEQANVIARKDFTNQSANADVVVDGKTILENVPATNLLYLEKQLVRMKTFISKLPILDSVENWELDKNSGFYKTKPTLTNRTKKTQKPIVLYNATAEHPAQTQLITEDIVVGQWEQVKYSSAINKDRLKGLILKVDLLIDAVKIAREQANSVEEIEGQKIGEVITAYILG